MKALLFTTGRPAPSAVVARLVGAGLVVETVDKTTSRVEELLLVAQYGIVEDEAAVILSREGALRCRIPGELSAVTIERAAAYLASKDRQ
jgi:hypothetical protein